jgi:hypothetical protein
MQIIILAPFAALSLSAAVVPAFANSTVTDNAPATRFHQTGAC